VAIILATTELEPETTGEANKKNIKNTILIHFKAKRTFENPNIQQYQINTYKYDIIG